MGLKSSIEGSNPSLTAIVCFIYSAPVAQLDRVLGYEPSGQRFESSRVRHFSFLSLFSLNFLNKIFVDFNPFSDYDRTYFYLINLIFLC